MNLGKPHARQTSFSLNSNSIREIKINKILFIFVFFFLATHSNTQGLLLVPHAGITPAGAQRTLWTVGDQTQD